MATSSSSPQSDSDHSPQVVWRQLCEGLSAPWLDEPGSLPVESDDLETSLDIWSVGLTAALKDPARQKIASQVLARLHKLADVSEATAELSN